MSNGLQHAAVNLGAYLGTSLLVPLLFPATRGALEFSWGFLVAFVVGGVVFDVDHLAYYGITTRPFSVAAIARRMRADYAAETPHFYACHTLEFVVGFAILGLLGALGSSPAWAWVLGGWGLHLLQDVLVYLHHYRSVLPWLPYWSVAWYVARGRSPRRSL